jgi:hypothetical protein
MPEPLSDEELAELRAYPCLYSDAWSGAHDRIFATIDARDAEIARLREINRRLVDSHNGMNLSNARLQEQLDKAFQRDYKMYALRTAAVAERDRYKTALEPIDAVVKALARGYGYSGMHNDFLDRDVFMIRSHGQLVHDIPLTVGLLRKAAAALTEGEPEA